MREYPYIRLSNNQNPYVSRAQMTTDQFERLVSAFRTAQTRNLSMTPTVFRALKFAARKHRDQRRKGLDASPYVNHVIDVAAVLACEAGITDERVLVAAILHDTVEDTLTTFDELSTEFGAAVTSLVRELTDDKSLPKETRKQLQIAHASAASPEAKQLKIADKISNIREIVSSPAVGWSLERRLKYCEWAEQVVAGCRGVNEQLDSAFDAAIREARKALTGLEDPN